MARPIFPTLSHLAALTAMLSLGPGCVRDDDEDGDDATADTENVGSETAGMSAPLAEGPPAGGCPALLTEADCLAAPEWELFPHLDDSAVGGCTWSPTFRVVDLASCEVEPYGGDCVPPSYGDGCEGLNGAICPGGAEIGYTIDDDGTVRLGVGGVCNTGPLTGCLDVGPDPATGGDDEPLECSCGCTLEE